MSINGYAMRFVGFLLFLCEIRIIIISECTIHIHLKMILSMQNGTFVFAALEVRSWFDFSPLVTFLTAPECWPLPWSCCPGVALVYNRRVRFGAPRLVSALFFSM